MEVQLGLKILDLNSLDDDYHRQSAHLLVIGFARDWPNAWPTLERALDEVNELLREEKICRVAIAEDREVIGCIGGIPQYDGYTWELHPIVVHPDYQRKGIGTTLVLDFLWESINSFTSNECLFTTRA